MRETKTKTAAKKVGQRAKNNIEMMHRITAIRRKMKRKEDWSRRLGYLIGASITILAILYWIEIINLWR